MSDAFEEVCDALKASFTDDKEDSLTLVTMIDTLSEEVDEGFEVKEKEQFLELLLNLLEADTELVSAVGWDLPRTLLRFCNAKNIKNSDRLRKCKVVTICMAIFNLLALHAKPQECLVTTLELLSELNFKNIVEECHQLSEDGSDNNTAEEDNDAVEDYMKDRDQPEIIFGVKSYALFELAGSLIRRVATLHPSKYLEEAVTAIRKYVTNNTKVVEDVKFILRRVFAFCRGYIPPEPPRQLIVDLKMNHEEYDEIMNSEIELQVRLLRNLCTFSVAYCVKFLNDKTEVVYFHKLINKDLQLPEFYRSIHDIISRYYQIAFSFDIDLNDEFNDILRETRGIYEDVIKRINETNNTDKNAKSDILLKAGYYYEVQKTAREKEINPDTKGIILLSGFNYIENGDHLIDIDIADALYLYLRFASESLFSPTCHNVTIEGVARYWIWAALTTTDNSILKEKLAELSPLVLHSVLNLLLVKNCHQVNEEIRMITFTLITRILCLLPENCSYEFLMDELDNCAVVFGKSCVLGILRDLVIKVDHSVSSNNTDTEDLSESMAQLKINNEKRAKKTFITLDSKRAGEIEDLAIKTLKETKKSMKKDYILLVLNYIKFFSTFAHKWNKSKLNEFTTLVATNFSDSKMLPEINAIIDANEKLRSLTE